MRSVFMFIIPLFVVSGCGAGSATSPATPAPCIAPQCPRLPTYLAVAQRGNGEVTLYAQPFTGAPASVLSAPGVESFAAAQMVDTPGTMYIGEFPDTIATSNYPYTSITPSISAGVNDPAGLAFGSVQTAPNTSNAALYVANRGANEVAVYVPAINGGNTPDFTLNGLHAPNGVALDGKGDLWVSESSDVVEYAAPISETSVPAAVITTAFKAPSGIAFDPSGTTMYVSDAGTNSVDVFPPGASSPSVTITAGLNGPGVPYVTSTYIYVPNTGGNTVAAFALPLAAPVTPAWVNTQGMSAPSATILGF